MIDSPENYNEAFIFAKNNPTGASVHVLKNYYLQPVTTTFYELTVKKFSPMIFVLCRMYRIELPLKNFSLTPAQMIFNLHTGFDLLVIVYGLNLAISKNLGSCWKI